MQPQQPDLLFAVALVSGYLFQHHCHWAHFRSLRLTGYRIFFLSAAWGVVFAILGIAAARAATAHEWGASAASAWSSLLPSETFPYSGAGVWSLALALAAATGCNRMFDRDSAKSSAIRLDEDELLTALVDAAESFRKYGPTGVKTQALLFTMSDRKAYAGLVVAAPSVNRDEAFVKILPLVSGHRRQDDLKPTFDWNYVKLWSRKGPLAGRLDLFTTLIPMSGIRSLRAFDQEVYLRHFAETAKRTESDPELADATEDRSGTSRSYRGAVGLAAILAGLGLAAFARR